MSEHQKETITMTNLADAILYTIIHVHYNVFRGFTRKSRLQADHPMMVGMKARYVRFWFEARGENTWLYYGKDFNERI